LRDAGDELACMRSAIDSRDAEAHRATVEEAYLTAVVDAKDLALQSARVELLEFKRLRQLLQAREQELSHVQEEVVHLQNLQEQSETNLCCTRAELEGCRAELCHSEAFGSPNDLARSAELMAPADLGFCSGERSNARLAEAIGRIRRALLRVQEARLTALQTDLDDLSSESSSTRCYLGVNAVEQLHVEIERIRSQVHVAGIEMRMLLARETHGPGGKMLGNQARLMSLYADMECQEAALAQANSQLHHLRLSQGGATPRLSTSLL